MLKPQDIVILLKIISIEVSHQDSYEMRLQNRLAVHLCMSASEVNAGMKRLIFSGLLSPVISNDRMKKVIYLPNKKACEECLVSGVKYFFPVEFGAYSRGIVTSYAAPIMAEHFILGDDPAPVWPHGEGNVRGVALEPLYRSVPKSISQFPDRQFYDLLALIDVIRSGRARERSIAIRLLKEKLYDKPQRPASDSKSKNAGIRG
jgi:hypothetical protein